MEQEPVDTVGLLRELSPDAQGRERAWFDGGATGFFADTLDNAMAAVPPRARP
ncbi:hypothetical protein [Streptomyces sp. NPDC005549]|uniref:hypothetical protein n=1 Tax=Streptomyces sp. NPDC005549 TaxID=3154888 RepID=UPI0033B7A813